MRATRVLLLALLLGLALAAMAGADAAPRSYTVTVTAGAAPCAEVPVSVVLPAPADGGATPIARAGGVDVPCQAEPDDAGLRVTFIVAELAPGESRDYTLRFGGEAPAAPEGVVLTKEGNGDLRVDIGGKLFTRYVVDGGPKPYFYPVIGPTGTPVTRSFPMEEVEGESRDHNHHRSFWVTHDNVNGVNFWAEGEGCGRTVHRRFEVLESGPVYGRMVADVDWLAADGTKICEDRREIRIYNVPDGRLLDFDIAIRASEGPLTFGDTKEGFFGFRVADSMTVSAGQGHIVNGAGDTDVAAWGKPAPWCDYSGPVAGETVGIAIFDNAQNKGFPTHWHVRDYGLFCANIFGLSYFEPDSGKDGTLEVAAGDVLRFRYRVMMHRGDAAAADVADAYADYADPPRVAVAGE
jgi:hypothetical protein